MINNKTDVIKYRFISCHTFLNFRKNNGIIEENNPNIETPIGRNALELDSHEADVGKNINIAAIIAET